MRFTLTFQGELPPNADAKEKWRIRRKLEPQLRRLWDQPPVSDLSKYKDRNYKPSDCYVGSSKFGFEFIPLITTALDLRAELDALLLTANLPGPGNLIRQGGDIDNRLKTLFDALSMPANVQQVPNNPDVESDKRVFCLLEDDKLVTSVAVSNDRLLSIPDGSNEVLVVLRVHPTVFRATQANAALA
jgi:hypothetical protein